MSFRTSLESRLSREWRRRGWLAYLLLPLSILFGALIAIRRWLYSTGLMYSTRLPVPVIVVGNVYIGGTGKTPLVIWLAERLRERGFVPGVISGGHGSRSSQVTEVLGDTSAELAGDEPLLIRQRTGVPVFVARRRALAAHALLSEYPAVNVIIADDGLQHYALARDIEILLCDERGNGNGWLLPAGPLREPASRQADFRVINGGAATDAQSARPATTFAMRLTGSEAQWLSDRAQRMSFSQLGRGARVAAAAGIGNPERFFGMLRRYGVTLADTLPLPDHFDFDTNPFADLRADIILITEKDAVKCVRREAIASDPRLWVVPVQAAIAGPLSEHLVEKLRGPPTA